MAFSVLVQSPENVIAGITGNSVNGRVLDARAEPDMTRRKISGLKAQTCLRSS
jgi:hypothetical protein